MKNWSAWAAKTMAAGLMAAGLALGAGCDDGGTAGRFNRSVADQAYARGNGVVWLENKGADFWTVNRVSIGSGARGTSAGTYEVAPGSYVMSVSCTADAWKDQWGRTHYDTKASKSVGLTVVAGQATHAVLDSTGAGNEFSLVVVK